MFVNNVRNVNQALSKGLAWCANNNAREEPSRNGPVRVSNAPVMTVTSRPWERVLFGEKRDANPFFHLFEALWMLAGRNDLPWLAQFNKQMASYSDDGGKTQPAAYGHRWLNYFGYNQLDIIVEELKANPATRRCVLAMWNGFDEVGYESDMRFGDLQQAVAGSADVPCNTHCYFRINRGKLDITVLCRSNDLLWGAHGANAVHFSILQEYVAARVGCDVGVLYQFSNNYHYYTDVVGDYNAAMNMSYDSDLCDYYVTQSLEAMPMFNEDMDAWHEDLKYFMHLANPDVSDVELLNGPQPPHPITGWNTEYFKHVVQPMWWTWQAHKAKDYTAANRHAVSVYASDWRMACTQWIERRAIKHREKNNEAV